MTLDELFSHAESLRAEIGKVVQGQEEAVDLLLTALFARGHVLLEGPPGTAKTLLARSFAGALSLEFGRIQFTPDLMPGDVLGTSIYNFQTSEFVLTKGPVFSQILLADEINRAPPKTQAALLQAMNERMVTIDGTDHSLGSEFIVVATQNPIEQQGTYPLPEAQLDRFLFKVNLSFPPEDVELSILRQHANAPLDPLGATQTVRPLLDAPTMAAARQLIDEIVLDDDILAYILRLVRATRESADIAFGASTRAADAIAGATRATAALNGRDFAIPDDVKTLIIHALQHRIVLSPAAEIEGRGPQQVLENILNQIEAPPLIRPSRILLVAACVALGLSLVAVVMGDATRTVAGVPWVVLCALAIGDLLLSWPRRRSVSVEPLGDIFVGEQDEIALIVTPATSGMTGQVHWPEGVEGPTRFDLSSGQVRIPFRAIRRGKWRLSHLWLSWSSRFKLFEFVPKIAFGLEIAVVPNIRRVQSGEISTTVQSRLFGVKENRAIGEGTEFHQLRDFVPGMDAKSIDWKRSARHRSLVAKEVRAERNHHVIIALDNGYQMREEIAGLPKIDHAITAALATAWAAAIGGDLAGLYAYDAKPRIFLPPEPGRAAFTRLRSRTAELQYESVETNHTLAMTELNGRTPKRSLIIVFSDFVDTTSAELMVENINALAKRHLIVFVTLRDPILEAQVNTAPQDMNDVAETVSTGQLLRERRLVLERLQQIGVTVIDAEPGEISARLISTYLEIKAREMI